MKYKPNVCNISCCKEEEYRNHMCKKHYDFYAMNAHTACVMEEAHSLECGSASMMLRLKYYFHNLIHYTLDIPMSLHEHFPLEHVFLAELYSLRKHKDVDVSHYNRVIADFDIPENENISEMKILLNNHDIETSELDTKDKYLLTEKDLPSIVARIFSIISIILFILFYKWIQETGNNVREPEESYFISSYLNSFPYVCAFALIMLIGRMIPLQYNFFIERCFNMTMFSSLDDNVDLLNHIRFVKERKSRARGYYAVIWGISIGLTITVFRVILRDNSLLSWESIILSLLVSLSFVPLFYSYMEMALFSPVTNSLKRKRVSIDLYNADKRGGLKQYHRFLYYTFLYNEGIAIVLIKLFMLLPTSNWGFLFFCLLLFPRFNHGGWAFVEWFGSVLDFYREKKAEKRRLVIDAGSIENLSKMEQLNHIHATNLIPIIKYVISFLLLPYLLNQLPKLASIIQHYNGAIGMGS